MWALAIGSEFGPQNLQHSERARPIPGPGEVLVRLHAAALNYRDWEVVNGQYHEVFPAGLVPLSDGAGEVAAVGAGVTRWHIGDRVLGSFWQGWQAGEISQSHNAASLGGPVDGMLIEYAVLRSDGLVAIPSHLDYLQAACLPCAGLTAWQALVEEGRLQAGEWVLIQGTGGVALFALQFARLHGARVVILSSSDSKLARMRELGAEVTLNYRQQPDWAEAVQVATGGVDHVIEVGGPGTFAQSLLALRPGGQVNVIGYLGGKNGEINPLLILQSQARVRGIAVGPVASLQHMCRAIEAAQVRPIIDRVFELNQVEQAFEYLAAGQHLGKVVLRF